MKSKKLLLLVVATLTMLVLSAIAVITSFKLKEQATVPVTPNNPVSQPKAVDNTTDATESATICQTSFTVAELACGGTCTANTDCGAGLFCDTARTPHICAKQECTGKADACACSGDLSCLSKDAFKDVSGNSAGVYAYTDSIAPSSDVTRDQQFVYRISYKNTSAAALTGVSVTDTLPSTLTYVDGQTGCSAGSNNLITCTIGALAGNATGTVSFRVKVKGDAGAGSFTNTAEVKTASQSATCNIPLKVNVPNGPVCDSTCTGDNQCPSDLKCVSGHCRNTACSGEADCGCTPKCNDYCSDNSECPSDLKCVGNKCRNNSCTGETDCSCGTNPTPTPTPSGNPTPTPLPTKLPTVGTTLPTSLFIVAGALLTGLGMLLVGL